MKTWADLVARTTFVAPFPMRISVRPLEDGEECVIVEVDMRCVETGQPRTFYHYETFIPFERVGRAQAVAMLRDKLHRVLEYELDESLRVDGRQVSNPHLRRGNACIECPASERRIIMRIDRRERVFHCSNTDGLSREHKFPEGLIL